MFEHINVWKRGDERAPHKPLLILLALGRLAHGQERLVDFEEIEPKLKALLQEYGPTRKSYHPEFPFWHLQTDGLWEIPERESLASRKGSSNPTAAEFRRNHARGGFPEEVYRKLQGDPNKIHHEAQSLLEAHFPESYHDDILQAVGLGDLENAAETRKTVERRKRDPKFREIIIRAYEFKCAVCGLDLRLDNVNLCLEAAHIKWHQAGGPDIHQNGLCLCSLHHKAFDRGAFTLSSDYHIELSQRIHGDSQGMRDWFLRFHGREIRFPQAENWLPSNVYVNWHRKEVFRHPTRPVLFMAAEESREYRDRD
ncbi:MAG: HNH endonuclease [Planctomycetes bacterium]|nr:HNH endonuclease [Planctomycetota bacterium]